MEPYTPIPNSILGSTIWLEPPYVRVVWLTMLFTSLRDGRVLASVPGLANLAHVSVAECRDALSRLASPDPDSRTKDHEGRRIEPVDGGWQIFNRAKHRAAMGLDKGLSTPRVQKHRNAHETLRNGETPRNAHQDQDQDQDQDSNVQSKDLKSKSEPARPKTAKASRMNHVERQERSFRTADPAGVELFQAWKEAAGKSGAEYDWKRRELFERLVTEGVTSETVRLVVSGAKFDQWATESQKLSPASILGSAEQREKYIEMARNPPRKNRREPPQPNNLEQPYKLNIV